MLSAALLLDQMWNLPLAIGLSTSAILYTIAIHRFTEHRFFHKKPLTFYLSLILLLLVLGSPLTIISHLSFSLHMIQMSILFFIVPPLMIVSIPVRLYRKVQGNHFFKQLNRLYLSPLTVLIIFALLFFLYHLPFIQNAFPQVPFFHNGFIVLLLFLSFRMWFPIASPDFLLRPDPVQQKRYILLSGMLLLPACLYLIISAFIEGMDNPFFTQLTAHLCLPTSTTSIPNFPSLFNSKYDRALSGFTMLGIHKLSLMFAPRFSTEAPFQLPQLVNQPRSCKNIEG